MQLATSGGAVGWQLRPTLEADDKGDPAKDETIRDAGSRDEAEAPRLGRGQGPDQASGPLGGGPDLRPQG
jgi:hypothetical protein